jgi:hypothetical protein
MCSLILRDEAGHVAFHRTRIGDAKKLGLIASLVWALQFWVCGYGAATMLWVNHRRCLRAIGGDRSEYYREVAFEISRFLRRLFSPAQTRNDSISMGIPGVALPNRL